MDGKPLVSIITVVYNGEKYIQSAIESVINQTYKNVEYIIVDGGSTDNTLDIIKNYADHIDVLVSEKDEGVYDAMNKGIDLATGEWIGLVNSDDFLESDAIQNVIKSSNELPAVDIFHGLLRIIDSESRTIEIVGRHVDFLKQGMIEHPTCFIKKQAYMQFGKFDLKYKHSADYDFILRLKENNLTFCLIETILSNFRLGGMSQSSAAILETLEVRYRHKFISLGKWLVLAAFYRILFKLKRSVI